MGLGEDTLRACGECGDDVPAKTLDPKRAYICQNCVAAYHRKWRLENVEAARASVQRYKQTEKAITARRNHHLLTKYGIDPATFEKMKAAQGNCCQICVREFTATSTPCVDHCHTTGKIRALLCRICNASLGGFQDSPHLLRRAADYLEEH